MSSPAFINLGIVLLYWVLNARHHEISAWICSSVLVPVLDHVNLVVPEVNVDYTEGTFLLLLLRAQFILRLPRGRLDFTYGCECCSRINAHPSLIDGVHVDHLWRPLRDCPIIVVLVRVPTQGDICMSWSKESKKAYIAAFVIRHDSPRSKLTIAGFPLPLNHCNMVIAA